MIGAGRPCQTPPRRAPSARPPARAQRSAAGPGGIDAIAAGQSWQRSAGSHPGREVRSATVAPNRSNSGAGQPPRRPPRPRRPPWLGPPYPTAPAGSVDSVSEGRRVAPCAVICSISARPASVGSIIPDPGISSTQTTSPSRPASAASARPTGSVRGIGPGSDFRFKCRPYPSCGTAVAAAGGRDGRVGQRTPRQDKDPFAACRTAECLVAHRPVPAQAVSLGADHVVRLDLGGRGRRQPLQQCPRTVAEIQQTPPPRAPESVAKAGASAGPGEVRRGRFPTVDYRTCRHAGQRKRTGRHPGSILHPGARTRSWGNSTAWPVSAASLAISTVAVLTRPARASTSVLGSPRRT